MNDFGRRSDRDCRPLFLPERERTSAQSDSAKIDEAKTETLCPHDGQVSRPEQKASVTAPAFSFTEPAAFSMASSDTS